MRSARTGAIGVGDDAGVLGVRERGDVGERGGEATRPGSRSGASRSASASAAWR